MFEKSKILGVRAQMLATGAKPLVVVPPGVIRTIDIAKMEFEKKRIPCSFDVYCLTIITKTGVWKTLRTFNTSTVFCNLNKIQR